MRLKRLLGISFTLNEYRPAQNMMLVDLTGVSAGKLQERMRSLDSASVKSYRVLTYTGKNGAEVTRVELALAPGASVQVDKQNSDLTLKVTGAETVTASNSASAQAAPAVQAPAIAAAAPVAIASPSPVLIRSISVARGANGMEVSISPKTSAPATAMALSGPDRLVIDLPNALPAVKTSQILVNSAEVKDVRISRYQENPPVTRVVIDMASAHDFQLVRGDTDLVVKLQPTLAKAMPPAAAQQAQAAPMMAKAEVPAAVAPEPKKDVPAAQPFVMVDAEKPVQMAKPPVAERSLEAASVMATTIAKDKVDAPVPVAASMPPQNVAANPAQEQQAQQRVPQATSGPRYTGEPISVNLKDVDLKDFF